MRIAGITVTCLLVAACSGGQARSTPPPTEAPPPTQPGPSSTAPIATHPAQPQPMPQQRAPAESRPRERPTESRPQQPAPAKIDGPPWAGALVDAHNRWRAQVNVPPLVWSSQLAARASAWADKLKRRGCPLEHNTDRKPFGENLAMSMGQSFTPEQVVEMWVSERRDYSPANGQCRKGQICGHYTQVVWRDTREVGCATVSCGATHIWVCSYSPPGNMMGRKAF